MPGPFPTPLSSVKLMLAVPPGWTGADARLRQNIGGTFDGAPTTSCSASRIRAGHPGGPEPAGPERFPPDDFKRF